MYQNALNKACFQHDMVYPNFEDLPWRTASYKVLHDKAFNIPKIENMLDIKGLYFDGVWFFW